MSNIRLFFQESLSINSALKLDKSQSHYLTKVMRMNIGKNFSLFNQNGEWEARITKINKGIVELGISKFIPILTERTIVRKINEKRLNKIIVEASEQSNRLKVPKLEEIVKLDNFLKFNQKTKIIFGDLNTNNNKLILKNTDPLCILIGPEGDFSLKEREKILKLKNIIPLKINENILRSETAAISMISIVTFNLLS